MKFRKFAKALRALGYEFVIMGDADTRYHQAPRPNAAAFGEPEPEKDAFPEHVIVNVDSLGTGTVPSTDKWHLVDAPESRITANALCGAFCQLVNTRYERGMGIYTGLNMCRACAAKGLDAGTLRLRNTQTEEHSCPAD